MTIDDPESNNSVQSICL